MKKRQYKKANREPIQPYEITSDYLKKRFDKIMKHLSPNDQDIIYLVVGLAVDAGANCRKPSDDLKECGVAVQDALMKGLYDV